MFHNQDTAKRYEIEFEVLEGGDVAYESVVRLGPGISLDDPDIEFSNESVRPAPLRREGGTPESDSPPSGVVIDEGWSREPAEYVTRARLDGGEWATVDVTEEARSRYLGVQYVTNDGSISAPFLQHHDSLAEAYHRREA